MSAERKGSWPNAAIGGPNCQDELGSRIASEAKGNAAEHWNPPGEPW